VDFERFFDLADDDEIISQHENLQRGAISVRGLQLAWFSFGKSFLICKEFFAQ
jgi:hypothetical protein